MLGQKDGIFQNNMLFFFEIQTEDLLKKLGA